MNLSTVLRVGYKMIKPFLNEEVKQSILFHNHLDSFHKYVDKEILPEELGGTQGTFNNSAASSAVYNISEYFEQVHNYVNLNLDL